MAVNTSIEWCDHTINFWRGCEKVSPGCQNCYAESFARRVGDDIWGAGKPRRWIKSAAAMARKLNTQAKREGVRFKVFINSMSDFFEEDTGQLIVDHTGRKLAINDGQGADGNIYRADQTVEDDWGCRNLTLTDLRDQAFQIIDECQHLDWLLVTKRPENIFSVWPQCATDIYANHRPNVWLLTSVENQQQADRRIPHLLKCRDLVPVLGLSMEPLLSRVDLNRIRVDENLPYHMSALHEHYDGNYWSSTAQLDWVIAGGESGHNSRPLHPDLVRSIRDQCQAAEVPFFFKQWGEYLPASQGATLPPPLLRNADQKFERVGKKRAGRLLDGQQWSQFPDD